MTLRLKTLVIIGATFISLVLLLYLVSRSILISSFTRLEERNTRQNVERVLSTLSNEISFMDAIVADWASWDDTYAFIEDANVDYIERNLVDETFT